MPFSEAFACVSPKFNVPLAALTTVTAVIAALGCIYLGSSTLFKGRLGSAVTINNVAYLIPILTNIATGRKKHTEAGFSCMVSRDGS